MNRNHCGDSLCGFSECQVPAISWKARRRLNLTILGRPNNTELRRSAIAWVERAAAHAGTDRGGGKQINHRDGPWRHSARSAAKPKEVADLIALLVSARAASITGTAYVIDGITVPTV
jgi:NAD(P)-dependent dehydrogenase (short-subunit alcohol dehydrogenase family)